MFGVLWVKSISGLPRRTSSPTNSTGTASYPPDSRRQKISRWSRRQALQVPDSTETCRTGVPAGNGAR